VPDFGLSQDAILTITLAFLIAGLVKGVVGGGLPAVAVPIMVGAVEPTIAASLTLMPVIVTNFWLLFQGGHFGNVMHCYWPFLLTLAIGSAIGAQILVTAPSDAMSLIIGLFIVILSPLPFIQNNWVIPERTQKWLNPIAAGGMGRVAGATMMLAPIIVYMVALRMDKSLFVASMGAVALASMGALFITLDANQVLACNEILMSAAALMPALIGITTGT
jgi:uncharacterized membrane protein YfcA